MSKMPVLYPWTVVSMAALTFWETPPKKDYLFFILLIWPEVKNFSFDHTLHHVKGQFFRAID